MNLENETRVELDSSTYIIKRKKGTSPINSYGNYSVSVSESDVLIAGYTQYFGNNYGNNIGYGVFFADFQIAHGHSEPTLYFQGVHEKELDEIIRINKSLNNIMHSTIKTSHIWYIFFWRSIGYVVNCGLKSVNGKLRYIPSSEIDYMRVLEQTLIKHFTANKINSNAKCLESIKEPDYKFSMECLHAMRGVLRIPCDGKRDIELGELPIEYMLVREF